MFGENLRVIRKAKGYTQEEFAIKLKVVRQTVSKWEKGLSVPDAEILSQMAEILDVKVSELLGGEFEEDMSNKNEIAEQLSKINEQLAIKNRRNKKIMKVIAIIIGIIVFISIVLLIIGIIAFCNYRFIATTSNGL